MESSEKQSAVARGAELDAETQQVAVPADAMEIIDRPAPWWDVLDKVRVADVRRALGSSPLIVTIKSDDKVSTLFETLYDQKILGAVVVDPVTSAVRGFVDVYDIVTYVLVVLSGGNPSPSPAHLSKAAEFTFDQFDAARVGNLVNLSGVNEMNLVGEGAALVEVMRLMERNAHRVGVLDKAEHLTAILSQSDVVRYLAYRGVSLGAALGQPLSILDLGKSPVVTVKETDRVVDALFFMKEKKISAVAVVDKRGLLTCTFSASDLKGMDPHALRMLLLPIKDFLLAVSGLPRPPVFVREGETLEHALLKLSFHGLHRLWLVDEKMRPTGVITLTDVITFFLSHSN